MRNSMLNAVPHFHGSAIQKTKDRILCSAEYQAVVVEEPEQLGNFGSRFFLHVRVQPTSQAQKGTHAVYPAKRGFHFYRHR